MHLPTALHQRNTFNWSPLGIWRLALLALALALLQGCSAIKLGYGKADDLAYWWLDGYADFAAPQSEPLRAALGDVHRWHRTQELPLYAGLLQQAQTLAADNITPAQVCNLAEAGQLRLNALAAKALPALTAAAMDLSGKQLMHMERQWAKKNATWQDDWLKPSPAEREKKRMDSMLERFESFYGNLTPAQVQLLRQQVQQSVWTAPWAWRDRVHKQQLLLELLRSLQLKSPNSSQAQDALQSMIQSWTSTTEGYGFETRQRLKQEACTNVAQLHNTSTPAQRLKAIQRLRAYATDFQDLSAP